MTVTTKRSLIALLLSLVLVVSLFTVGISASSETASVSATEATSETQTSAEKESETVNKEAEALEKLKAETQQTLIINAVIVGVIILIIVLVAIKFRKRLGDFLRSVKSELKKIVWSSKENTRKGFLVVVVVAVCFAIMIGLIDLAFNTGISMLASLFD